MRVYRGSKGAESVPEAVFSATDQKANSIAQPGKAYVWSFKPVFGEQVYYVSLALLIFVLAPQ